MSAQRGAARSENEQGSLNTRLLAKKAEILAEWEKRVCARVPAAGRIPKPLLIDSLPKFLEQLANSLGKAEPARQQLRQVATEHTQDRVRTEDYTLEQLLMEYQILRDVLMEFLVLEKADLSPARFLMESLDTAITHAVAVYRSEILNHLEARAGAEKRVGLGKEQKPETRFLLTEARYKILVDSVRDYAIFTLDPTGFITSWNPGARRTSGYEADEILGKNFSILYTQEDRERSHPEEELKIALETERYEEEGWRVRKDGSRFWANVIITPMKDPSGKLIGFAKVTRDLTERKKAEEDLRKSRDELELRVRERTSELVQSETNFRATFEQAAVGIGHVASDGKWLRVNDRLCQILGYTREELLKLSFQEITHAEDLSADLENFASLSKGKLISAYSMEKRYFRKDRTIIWANLTVSAVRDPDGRARYFIAVIEDISHRKKVEDELQFLIKASRTLASSLDYKTTLRAVGALAVPQYADWCIVDTMEGSLFKRVAVLHSDFSKINLTRELETFHPDLSASGGASRALKIGATVSFSDALSLPDAEKKSLFELGTTDPRQLSLIQALGVKSYVSVLMKVREESVGAITFVRSRSGTPFSQDEVTTFEQLARIAGLSVDNSRLFSRTQEAMKSREDVLAVVSHDLKNPLSAMALNLELMTRAIEKNPALKPFSVQVDRIRSSATRMQHLIQDLLDVTKVEAGTFSVDKKQEHIEQLIHETIDLLNPLAAEKEIKLTAQIGPACCPILADHTRILQVFSNLVGNAIKFTPKGGEIKVGAKNLENEIRFSVTDTGPGISKEDQPRVFSRYWQAKETATKGVGLGLAISRGIVEAHGGRIWLESEPGQGTTFFFTLPK